MGHDWEYLYYFRQNNKVYKREHFFPKDNDINRGVIPNVFWPPPAYHLFMLNFMQVTDWPASPVSWLEKGEEIVVLNDPPPPEPRAACLINIDEKMISIFEYGRGQTTTPVRRAYIFLMNQVWPDWHVHWVNKGYSELLELIGFKQVRKYYQSQSFEPIHKLSISDQILEWGSIMGGFWPLELQHNAYDNTDGSNYTDDVLNYLQVELDPNCIVTLKNNNLTLDYGFSGLNRPVAAA